MREILEGGVNVPRSYKKRYNLKIKEQMEKLGIYSPEYDKSIELLAQTLQDLDKTRQQFIDEGEKYIVKYTNKNGSTNSVKNPLYQTICELNDRAIKYLNELGLTPQGMKKIKDMKDKSKGSKLDEILGGMSG